MSSFVLYEGCVERRLLSAAFDLDCVGTDAFVRPSRAQLGSPPFPVVNVEA
jgi:hypothetical protein